MAKNLEIAAENEIIALRQELEKHNYQYHVLDDPLISDADYDPDDYIAEVDGIEPRGTGG